MTQAEVLMTPEEAPVLTIEDVSIQFGDFKAVKHVSTEVGKNEVRFFIGPNGAGKTTILDAICGKNRVSGGHIIFHGENGTKDVSKMKEYAISDLGIGRKFQAPSVFQGITIEENMELAVARRHSLYSTTFRKLSKEKQDYMNHVLEFIGLADKRFKYPGSLSHGEKQWLEIGMLLAASPKLKQNTDSSSPFSSIIFRNIPSAIGLRQMLAVQTNTIFMIIVIPLCIQRAFRPPLFYQPLASYQVFPTLASATIGTVRETAPSISSVRIRAACSASSSGASTISSS